MARFIWIEDRNSSATPEFFVVSDRFAKHVKALCLKHEKDRGVFD